MEETNDEIPSANDSKDPKQINQDSQEAEDKSATENSRSIDQQGQQYVTETDQECEDDTKAAASPETAGEKDPLLQENTPVAPLEPPESLEDAEPMEIDSPHLTREEFVSASEQHEEPENCDSVSESENPENASLEEHQAESQEETSMSDSAAVESLERCHESRVDSATNVLTSVEKPEESECSENISGEKSTSEFVESECLDQTSVEKSPVTASESPQCLEKSPVITSECMLPVESECLDQTSVQKSPVPTECILLPVSKCLDETSVEKSQASSECMLPVESECLDQTSVQKSPVPTECILLPVSKCLDETSVEKAQVSSECILPKEHSQCLPSTSTAEDSPVNSSECILPEEHSQCLPSTSTAEEHHELRPIKTERPDSAPNSPEMVCGYPVSDNSDAEECQFEVMEVSYPWPKTETSEDVPHGCSRYQLSPALEQQAINNIMQRLESEQIPLAQSEIFKEIYKVVDNARVTHIVFSRPIVPLKLMIPLLEKYPQVYEKLKQIKTMHANFELERILSNSSFERKAVESIKKRTVAEKRPLTSQEIFQEIMRLARELGCSTKIFPHNLEVDLTYFVDRNPDVFVLSETLKSRLECQLGQFGPALERQLVASIMQRLEDEAFQVSEQIILEHAVKLAAEIGVTKRVFGKKGSTKTKFLTNFMTKHPEVTIKIKEVNQKVMALHPETCGCKAYKMSHSLELRILQRLLKKLENSTTLVAPIDIFREAIKVAKTAGVLFQVFPEYPKPLCMTKFLVVFLRDHPELWKKMQSANDLLRQSQQQPAEPEGEEEEEGDDAPVEFEVFYVNPANDQDSTGESSRLHSSGNFWMGADPRDLVKPCSVVLDRTVVEQYLAPVDLSLVAEVQGRRRANLLARAKLGMTSSTRTQTPDGRRRIARNPQLAKQMQAESLKRPKKRRSKSIVYTKRKQRKVVTRAVSPPSALDYLNDEYMRSGELDSGSVFETLAEEARPETASANIQRVSKTILPDTPNIQRVAETILPDTPSIQRVAETILPDTPSIQIKTEMSVEEHSLDSSEHSDVPPELPEVDDDDTASVGSGCVDIDLSPYGEWRSAKDIEAIKDRLKMVYFVTTQAPLAVPCLYCHWIFRDVLRLEYHVNRVHFHGRLGDKAAKKDNYKCDICQEPFGTKLFCQLHVYQNHDPLYLTINPNVKVLQLSNAVEAKLNYFSHNVPLNEATRQYLTRNGEKRVVRPIKCEPGTKQQMLLAPGFRLSSYKPLKSDAPKFWQPTVANVPKAWQPNEGDVQKSWQPKVTNVRSTRTLEETENIPRETGVQNVKETHIEIVKANEPSVQSTSPPKILTPQVEPLPSTSLSNPTISPDIYSMIAEPEPSTSSADVAGKDKKEIYKVCFVCKKRIALDSMTPVLRRTGLGFCCNFCVAESVCSKDGTAVIAENPPQQVDSHKLHITKSKKIKTTPIQFVEVPSPEPKSNTDKEVEITPDACTYIANDAQSGVQQLLNKAAAASGPSTSDASSSPRPVAMISVKSMQKMTGVEKDDLKLVTVQKLENIVPGPVVTGTVNEGQANTSASRKSPSETLRPDTTETVDSVHVQCQILKGTVLQCSECTKLMKIEKASKVTYMQQLVCVTCLKEPKTSRNITPDKVLPTPNTDYLCMYCRLTFSDAQSLVLHCNSCQKESVIALPCPHCNFKFTRLESLAQHIASIHQRNKGFHIKEHKCSLCSYRFLSQVTLKTHFIVDHHTCNICNQKFQSSKICFQHMRVHLKQEVAPGTSKQSEQPVKHSVVPVCSKTLSIISQGSEQPAKQNVVPVSSKTLSIIRRSEQPGLKQNAVPGLSKTPSILRQPGQPGLRQDAVPGSSKNPSIMQSEQPGLKQYGMAPSKHWICSFCHASFTDFNIFLKHRLTHNPPQEPTGQTLATRGVSVKSDSSSGMFNCKACKKSFLSLYHIQTHLRENHNLYNCCKCNKFFLVMNKGDSIQGFLKQAKFICSLCDINSADNVIQQSSDMMISNVMSLETDNTSSDLKIDSVASLGKSLETDNTSSELKIASVASLGKSLESDKGSQNSSELKIASVASLGKSLESDESSQNYSELKIASVASLGKSLESEKSSQNSSELKIASVASLGKSLESDKSSQDSSELKIASVTLLGKSVSQDESLKISSIASLNEEESAQSEPQILSVTSLASSKISNPDAENHLKNVEMGQSPEIVNEETGTSDVEVVPMDTSEN